MLRCKTDSENESACGGPVLRASKERGGCEITGSVALVRYSLRTKSSVLTVTLTFAGVTARNVLQQGRAVSFCFEGAFSEEDVMCIGQLVCGAGIWAQTAPNKQ
jgi:hypothetical protein